MANLIPDIDVPLLVGQSPISVFAEAGFARIPYRSLLHGTSGKVHNPNF